MTIIFSRITTDRTRRVGIALCCLLLSLNLSAQRTLTLEQLKDSALRNNIAIRTAKHDIEQAQQQRKEAFTKYFPSVRGIGMWFNTNNGLATLKLRPSNLLPTNVVTTMTELLPQTLMSKLTTPIELSLMKNGSTAGIMAMQPVFAGGQIINGNRLAKVGEEVSHLQLQLSENEVEKTTEKYFWQLATLLEKNYTIEAVTAFLADIHKDVDVAVKAGLVLRNDLLQVELRQNDVEGERMKLRNSISIVRMLMAQYCGLSDTLFAIDTEGILPERSGLDDTTTGSYSKPMLLEVPSPVFHVENLPEYQLLTKQVEASRLQTKMTIGENLPSVAVGAGYIYHDLLNNSNTTGMIFATISVPISAWWGGSHAIKRRKIEQQKAEEQLADNVQLLEIRMKKAWMDVEEAHQQLLIAERGVGQAEENLRINRDLYRVGTTRMSDLLDAQLLYHKACDKRTEAFGNYQNQLLEYRHSMGMTTFEQTEEK